MAPWLRVLEAYLIQALLRTPAFHRGVEKVAHRVHRLRNGLPPEPQGGTSVDDPANSNFLKHFSEEVQTQLGRAEQRNQVDTAMKRRRRAIPEEGEDAEAAWRASREESSVERGEKGRKVEAETEQTREDAEAAWRNAEKSEDGAAGPKQGFLGEYIGALREQVRKGK